jgi:hypothetical protein
MPRGAAYLELRNSKFHGDLQRKSPETAGQRLHFVHHAESGAIVTAGSNATPSACAITRENVINMPAVAPQM